MSERKTFAFSMDAPECQVCPYYDDCKNKRKVACAYLEPLRAPVAAEITQPLTEPVLAPHEYRNVKIGENTTVTIDLVEMKKKMAGDFYRPLMCQLFRGGA